MVVASAWVIAAAAAVPASAPPPRAPRSPEEPAVVRRVAEDELNRIEELRVRGETRRVVVRPKTEGAREYEIAPPSGAVDTSQGRRSSAGERVWRVFTF